MILFRQITLTEDNAAGPHGQCLLDHIFLFSAYDNGSFLQSAKGTAGCRKRDMHFTGERIKDIVVTVDDMPLQRAENVIDGDIFQHRLLNRLHVTLGDPAGSDHPEECSIFIGDRNGVQ